MAQKKLNELIQFYRGNNKTLSERRKADIEYEIWNIHSRIVGKGVSKARVKRDWLCDKLGGGPGQYEQRASILNAGVWTDPLWERMETTSMSLSTASLLCRKARNTARTEGIKFKDALVIVLEAYDTGKQPTKSKAKTYTNGSSSLKESVDDPRKFNKRVTELAEAYLSSRLEGVEPFYAEQAKTEFLYWIADAVKDLSQQVNKLRADAKKVALANIGRIRFEDACMTLSISGTFKKPVDLRKAKKRMKQRIHELHPDRTGLEDIAVVNELDAVRNAYETLEIYMKGLRANG